MFSLSCILAVRIFNTNNLWVSLRAVDRVLTDDTLKMEVIVNPKVRGVCVCERVSLANKQFILFLTWTWFRLWTMGSMSFSWRLRLDLPLRALVVLLVSLPPRDSSSLAASSNLLLPTLSTGVNVPRSRFLPVKKTSDLLLVMSNLYQIEADGTLRMNVARSYPSVPLVKLGDMHFAAVIATAERVVASV